VGELWSSDFGRRPAQNNRGYQRVESTAFNIALKRAAWAIVNPAPLLRFQMRIQRPRDKEPHDFVDPWKIGLMRLSRRNR
jgi:hypothetical protein